MARPRSSSITQALYPLRGPDELTHPLLWSDLPEELPDLTEEEAAALTWDQIIVPDSAEYSREKLMAILALKNNPGLKNSRSRTTTCVTSDVNASHELSTHDSDEPPVSDSEDDELSDLESAESELVSSDEEDYGQELDLDRKFSLDDPTPRVSNIEFWKIQDLPETQSDVEVCQ